MEIPNDLLVDLIFSVHIHSGLDMAKFHVSGINVYSRGVTVVFGYDGTDIGSITVPFASHQRNTPYYFHGLGDFNEVHGHAIVGDLSNIQAGSAGAFVFDIAGAQIQPCVVRPDLRGISSITLINGEDASDKIYGDIELSAGTNIRITPTLIGDDRARIRIDAIDGEGLTADCECNNLEDAPCIRTINGIPPNPTTGNFALEGDECLRVEADTNGVKLKDDCSAPCCGCDELIVLTQRLEAMLNEVNTLKNFISRLSGHITQFETNLLASRVSQIPCTPS